MVVSGQAQLLRRKVGDDPRALRALDAIDVAARRGEDLTRHLLSFSRRQRLTPAPTSLAERSVSLGELLAASLPATVRLDMALSDDLWPVAVDAGEFELSLLNLAVNARDAMPKGGALSLRGENVTLDGSGPGQLRGDFVALTVSDTGTGIAPDILPKIFDPFFTTKDVDKGTGLGLSQVFGFAQQSGGYATVESELGSGTRFTLYLPRTDRTPRAAQDEGPVPLIGSARVLLVEDNPEVAEVAARMLEELGHEVRVVGNSAAALTALQGSEPVDVVFSDIVMAGDLDGLDMARRVRETFPDVPVVLATGYSEAAARIGDEFPILRKPYKLADLNRAIARSLETSSAKDDKLVDLEAARRARGANGK
jgi:CheY-like chemotaxis protein